MRFRIDENLPAEIAPVRCLAENLASLKSAIATETLDRFERAFKRLNALL